MYKKQMFYDIRISTAVQIISIKNKYYHEHAHLEKNPPLFIYCPPRFYHNIHIEIISLRPL